MKRLLSTIYIFGPSCVQGLIITFLHNLQSEDRLQISRHILSSGTNEIVLIFDIYIYIYTYMYIYMYICLLTLVVGEYAVRNMY